MPLATGIAPFLTPIAAFGLALLEIGAIVVHIRRGEQNSLGVNVGVLLLAATVAGLGSRSSRAYSERQGTSRIFPT